MHHPPLKTLITLIACLFLSVQGNLVFAQGTDFFSTPEKKKVTPPKKVSKPKALPKPVPKPKPKPKPKPVVAKKPDPKRSISDVIFLLDTSGSMDAFLPEREQSKLNAAQQALTYFARNMREGTRFQLWSFNARLKKHPNSPAAGKSGNVVFEPIGGKTSKVRKHLIREVENLETRGGTNLYQSVFQALRYFRSSSYKVPPNTTRRKIIVVLADGQDDGLSQVKLPNVLDARRRNKDVKIRTIGFGITTRDPLYQVLCQMASDRKSCTVADDAASLKKIITSFSEDR